MGIFKKKNDELLDDLLNEIEKTEPGQEKPAQPQIPPAKKLDNTTLPPMPLPKAMPPAPRPPAAPRPPMKPAPSMNFSNVPMPTMQKPTDAEKPALATEDVAKLPLFMKVQEYDKIVKELAGLKGSLKNMEDLLEKMSGLEKDEDDTTVKWREQLDKTKEELEDLISTMPETGRMKEVLNAKESGKTEIRKELSEIKENIRATAARQDPNSARIATDVSALRGTINSLQNELRGMNSELRDMKKVQTEKKAVEEAQKDKPVYTKTKMIDPWG